MAPLLKKLLWHVRERGFAPTLRRACEIVWRKAVPNAAFVYAADASLPARACAVLPEGFTVTPYSSLGDVPTPVAEAFARKKAGRAAAENLLRFYLDEGAHLWVSLWHGELAGYRFSAHGRDTAARHFRYFPLPENDAFIFAGETFPEHRGKKVAPMSIDVIAGALLADGAPRVYIACERWNVPSQRSIGKTRFAPLGAARPLRLGRWRMVLWKRGRNPESESRIRERPA